MRDFPEWKQNNRGLTIDPSDHNNLEKRYQQDNATHGEIVEQLENIHSALKWKQVCEVRILKSVHLDLLSLTSPQGASWALLQWHVILTPGCLMSIAPVTCHPHPRVPYEYCSSDLSSSPLQGASWVLLQWSVILTPGCLMSIAPAHQLHLLLHPHS
jgi:hypothetical protein